jgi:hypothetical protein
VFNWFLAQAYLCACEILRVRGSEIGRSWFSSRFAAVGFGHVAVARLKSEEQGVLRRGWNFVFTKCV